ncbi:MAG: helicase HerA domain-containing protein [Gammaproteobacteria bacterium]
MQDFEKLGAFYLGKRFDSDAGLIDDELTLYDSNDLTTHAVIIGMTGSGKTGLGVGLIEEAALDHIPVIAIDPKGDLGNLLLSFPKLRPADFAPWVDPRAATEAGQDPEEFAAATAAMWKNGLADWGQTPQRIVNLRKAADFSIYTPGSSAGRQLSVLKEFAAPPPELQEDRELYQERIQGTVNSLLTLLGIDADDVTSRENILLCAVLDRAWSEGRNLDLAGLIGAIQNPGIASIGVMDLDSFYPAKDRFALAMRMNNLLAAPGFDAWMQGEPMDVGRLMHTDSGQPRVSVMSIAHLDDAQRMFFVTMLLSEIVTWMRRQPGSGSLRAILYMDEIFGFIPPVANPPSKRLFLTLLKQARAYGLGVVMATQNPVDLDYKGLSNTGTWFIGRLQTERDKARVRDGLQGAAGSQNLDPATIEQTLSGLGKRRFLLHNVHEKSPVIFQTRWVMSYLAGPLTRDQVKRLTPRLDQSSLESPAATPVKAAQSASRKAAGRPMLPPGIKQYFLPPDTIPAEDERVVYTPYVIASVRAAYSNSRVKVDERKEFMLLAPTSDGPIDLDWNDADELELEVSDLGKKPVADAGFSEAPAALSSTKNFTRWQKSLKTWLREERPIRILRSPHLREYSRPEEDERDFRIRLQQLGNDARDIKVAKLRKRFEGRVARLEERLRRAEQAVDREAEQARGSKVDTAISFGTAVLGAVLGRKRISTTSASRVGTAMRKAGRMSQQSADVRRAKETVESVKAQLETLQIQFDEEVDALDAAYDAQDEELTETVVRPKSTGIDIRVIGVGWLPSIEAAE